MVDEFAYGVACVSLAPITDPTLVAPTVASALDVWEAGDELFTLRLKALLRNPNAGATAG